MVVVDKVTVPCHTGTLCYIVSYDGCCVILLAMVDVVLYC